MFGINFDPLNLGTTGAYFDASSPGSTTKHDVILTIANAIVGTDNSPWEIVTDAAPTPAFLQGYPSTITEGGTTTGNSPATAPRLVLYNTAHPGLLEASPFTVCIVIWSGTLGPMVGLWNSRHGAITNDTDFVYYGSSSWNSSTNILYNGGHANTYPWRCYVIVHDYSLTVFFRSFGAAIQGMRYLCILTPPIPSAGEGSVSLDKNPMIFGVSHLAKGITGAQGYDLAAPRSQYAASDADGDNAVLVPQAHMGGALDETGMEWALRAFVGSPAGYANPFAFAPLKELRLVRTAVYATESLPTIDGVDYIALTDSATNPAFLIALEDVSPA